ncbi:MAG: DUF3164 family protein [Holosporales bacterium]|jgi:hypothetical protein|nr:DUF3164 family protein [Holosporales bacterium]
MKEIYLDQMTEAELKVLLKQKKEQMRQNAQARRDAYESLRLGVLTQIEGKVREAQGIIKNLFCVVKNETDAFYDVMREYGELHRENQQGFSIKSDNFKIEVAKNRVKKFDERADLAAERLIKFLRSWIKKSQEGQNDPMYQLAMSMLERNQQGDLDYKSISKLYDLESQFDDNEYSEIMNLFKESNVIEGTATNYYFYELSETGAWKKIEVSFNRM